MEATLHALGGLLIKAIPTFLLVLLLHFYLKAVFFRPMAKVLEERRQATEGTRRKADELLARAAARAAEYEEAIRAVRLELFREQEAARERRRQEHAAAVQAAREQARRTVSEAQRQIQAELAAARAALEARSRTLAQEIAELLLGGKAA